MRLHLEDDAVMGGHQFRAMAGLRILRIWRKTVVRLRYEARREALRARLFWAGHHTSKARLPERVHLSCP